MRSLSCSLSSAMHNGVSQRAQLTPTSVDLFTWNALSGQLAKNLVTAFCLAAPLPLRPSVGAGSQTSMKSAISACR